MFDEVANDQDFPKLIGGETKGGGLDNVEYCSPKNWIDLHSEEFMKMSGRLRLNKQVGF